MDDRMDGIEQKRDSNEQGLPHSRGNIKPSTADDDEITPKAHKEVHRLHDKRNYAITPDYLHIYQGQGGLLKLPLTFTKLNGTTEEVYAVGTSECKTCVGVYFPIGKEYIFAAHIDGHLIASNVASEEDTSDERTTTGGGNTPMSNSMQSNTSSASDLSSTWKMSDDELGQQLSQQVYKTLEEECEKAFAAAKRPNGLFLATEQERAIIVCPRTKCGTTSLTGEYIVKGIREYLGMDPDLGVSDYGHGFVQEMDRGDGRPLRRTILGWSDEQKRRVDVIPQNDWDKMSTAKFYAKYHTIQPIEDEWCAVNGRPWTFYYRGCEKWERSEWDAVPPKLSSIQTYTESDG